MRGSTPNAAKRSSGHIRSPSGWRIVLRSMKSEKDGFCVAGLCESARSSLRLPTSLAQPETSCRACLADLLLWISTVNQRLRSTGSRYTILPFKLHQFISQTGSVYTTLDQDENRFITLGARNLQARRREKEADLSQRLQSG